MKISLAATKIPFAAAARPTIRANVAPSVVTAENLNAKITEAKTPADHEPITACYKEQATEIGKERSASRVVRGNLHGEDVRWD